VADGQGQRGSFCVEGFTGSTGGAAGELQQLQTASLPTSSLDVLAASLLFTGAESKYRYLGWGWGW
jgi:hypothetical protein